MRILKRARQSLRCLWNRNLEYCTVHLSAKYQPTPSPPPRLSGGLVSCVDMLNVLFFCALFLCAFVFLRFFFFALLLFCAIFFAVTFLMLFFLQAITFFALLLVSHSFSLRFCFCAFAFFISFFCALGFFRALFLPAFTFLRSFFFALSYFALSAEKLPPHVVMTSLDTYKTKCREKVISFKVPVLMDNEGSVEPSVDYPHSTITMYYIWI